MESRANEVFYLLDHNNDIVEKIVGYNLLVVYTYQAIRSGRIKDSFKNPNYDGIINSIGWCKTEFVIVDRTFRIVPIRNILKDYTEPIYRTREVRENWQFRKDPIPGTGSKSRYWIYSKAAQRKQQFRQEYRYSFEHKEFIRAKRRYGAFNPVARRWDDDPRGCYENKHSWKKIKKHKQWM